MIIDSEVIGQARAFADSTDTDLMSVDLQSLVASFRHRDEKGSERAAYAHGRSLLKLAEREGLEVPDPPSRATTVPQLKAEIASRNEGRDEADLIKPASAKKADLKAAIAADDDARG